MRGRLFVAVLALAAMTAVLSAQAFNLKLGQWEYSIGGMKIPPEMLANLPPAARAQTEQMMKQSQTHRSCLTAQDLKNLNLGKNDDDDCKVGGEGPAEMIITGKWIAATCKE